MYKYFVIIGITVVALGWIAYGIYEYIARKREDELPPKRSERYNQAQNTMSEYAKKMAEFEKKRHDKKQ
jgi:hypothetical protein